MLEGKGGEGRVLRGFMGFFRGGSWTRRPRHKRGDLFEVKKNMLGLKEKCGDVHGHKKNVFVKK